MERLLIIGALFVATGLCEIGGGYLVWGWVRDHKPLAWALLGALILAAYTSPPTRTSTMPLVMRFQVASPTVKRVSPRYGPLSLTS